MKCQDPTPHAAHEAHDEIGTWWCEGERDDIIARAAEVIWEGGDIWESRARVAAERLAAAGLLAVPPDDTTARLIKAAIARRQGYPFAGPFIAAVDAYLAAHPEAQP